MPETPEAFWERTHAALQMPPVHEWETWPFEGGLTPQPLAPPVGEEPKRRGEGGVDCWRCDKGEDGAIWSNEHWVVTPLSKPSGLPIVVLLETRRHYDFGDLPDELTAELGPLLLKVQRAVFEVGDIGNVHVCRWGEGSAHFHMWFMGRPARMPQLSDSFAAIWDDILPPLPEELWRANLAIVAEALSR